MYLTSPSSSYKLLPFDQHLPTPLSHPTSTPQPPHSVNYHSLYFYKFGFF